MQNNCSCRHQKPAGVGHRTAAKGRFEPTDYQHSNGRNRRSAEARDPADGLPLTVRERTFALRPSNGKVCPLRDLASEVVHPPSRAISWTDLSPTACQADGIAVIRRAASPLLFSGGIWNHGAIAGFGWLFWRQRGVELSRSRPGPHYQADNLRGHLLANGHAARRQNTKIHQYVD